MILQKTPLEMGHTSTIRSTNSNPRTISKNCGFREYLFRTPLFSCLCVITMAARFHWASRKKSIISQDSSISSQEPIIAIVPFRNENSTLKKTLPTIASEVSRDGNSKLILVDSNSEDDSAITAAEIMNNSDVNADSWIMISLKTPGKGRALNAAMKLVREDEIVVLIDADAIIPDGSFESFRCWMSSSI